MQPLFGRVGARRSWREYRGLLAGIRDIAASTPPITVAWPRRVAATSVKSVIGCGFSGLTATRRARHTRRYTPAGGLLVVRCHI